MFRLLSWLFSAVLVRRVVPFFVLCLRFWLLYLNSFQTKYGIHPTNAGASPNRHTARLSSIQSLFTRRIGRSRVGVFSLAVAVLLALASLAPVLKSERWRNMPFATQSLRHQVCTLPCGGKSSIPT